VTRIEAIDAMAPIPPVSADHHPNCGVIAGAMSAENNMLARPVW